ncbi:hypothetical protein ACFWV1_26240 [Streptomyces sp. NPDC058700]|uniref:hypothetical protein n=1 Tax=Streptomyces sp. NPDC058700 TaxID=3346607 RepID=UPI003657B8D3
MTDYDSDTPQLTPHGPNGDMLLHLPEITYLDTQVWSVDIGLTPARLAELRTMLGGGAARTASGQQPETEPLRPRAERCPEPECTDEQQCWRCDYEESQHAARRPAAPPTCTSTHPARPTRCILPGRHAVPHTNGTCQWPETVPAVGQPAEAQATDVCSPRIRWAVEHRFLAGTIIDPPIGISDRAEAEVHLEETRARWPEATHRLVRETTTWTVEDER